ncbi:MAG TPA: hypothetical protein VGQ29_12470 [Gemmatimonadales bacterium]|jgi:hypothetical protein|nr:hypothetical protein [Gemmatimonadales bacterium]
MYRVLRPLPLALTAAVLAACGKDSSGPAPGFECLGQPLPTTAPSSITIAGQTKGNLLSQTALSGVEIIVSRTGTDTLGADTSDTPGFFSISVTTGGTPVDGHLQLKKSGYLSTYAYPSRPLAADDDETVLMINPTEFSALAATAGVTPQAGKGFVGVIVRNCAGEPLEGATVTSSPTGTVRYNLGGLPSSTATSTAADGIAYIANVTAGNVTVQSTASGHTLRQHVVNARADAITVTQIQP